jgi:hypothetical protein
MPFSNNPHLLGGHVFLRQAGADAAFMRIILKALDAHPPLNSG